MCNEFGHGGDVGLMRRLLVVDVAGRRKRAKICLGIAQMLNQVGPRSISEYLAIPKTKILLENGLFGEDDIGQINHLLWTHW